MDDHPRFVQGWKDYPGQKWCPRCCQTISYAEDQTHDQTCPNRVVRPTEELDRIARALERIADALEYQVGQENQRRG